jgi:hypothetical protein
VPELNYDPILITCFEGLIEEKHPYSFIAFAVIKDMLEDEVIMIYFIEIIMFIIFA